MDRQQEQPLIGESPGFLEVLERVSRVAQLNRPVLVIGERGTGKELVAARVHYLSPRWDRPFVKLNCAALAESLLETELFGHEAGSFTGAVRRRLGRFELANEGSLFLDELSNTSERVQEKVLRVIEYGELERVGGNDTISTDVRIIGATNEDLPALAEAGKFRPDLLDRLAFDVITLPPLRERRDDILPLAEHFAVKMSGELGLELFQGFSDEARELLLDYAWPGNVRQLENVIQNVVVLYDVDDAGKKAAAKATRIPRTTITSMPASEIVRIAATVATGTATDYGWFKDGVFLTTTTVNTLTLASVTLADSGDYTVTASNACGNVTSASRPLFWNAPLASTADAPLGTEKTALPSTSMKVRSAPLTMISAMSSRASSGSSGP